MGRAVELKVSDRTLRDVEDCRADCFVCDVLPIKQDAGGSAGDSAGRDSRIAGFRWIEGFSALKDDARLNLRKIEKVAAIYRKRIDLIFGDNVADASLLSIDLKRTRTDLDRFSRRAQR
ncbi:hypothetical protein RBB78_03465 [Tunturiibacter empetritectus]|uniref:hypothetical protein n=1 Tax=Tunturiibacter empetritectus TaxID=3069691 RepID=UPI003D9BDC12